MLAAHEFATPSLTSIVTIDAVLSDPFGINAHPSEPRPPLPILPEWSSRFLRPVAIRRADMHGRWLAVGNGGRRTWCCGALVLSGDRGSRSPRAGLVAGSCGAGRKTASPRDRGEPVVARECASPDRALARHVSAASIAATLGRSPSSIHGKRRWLGLGVRTGNGSRNARSPNVGRLLCRGSRSSMSARSSRGSSVRGPASRVVPGIDPLVSFRSRSNGRSAGTRKKTMGFRFSASQA